MSKAELSREGQEWRRLRAWKLWQQGWKQKDIAIALGVTKGAVSQWIKRGREEGAEGLRWNQEYVWNLLKRRELKNLCCQDLTHLGQELVRAKERLRHRREILQNCFAHALRVHEQEV